MTWTPPLLPTGVSDRLALIVAELRVVLAAHMAKDRSAVAVLFLAWARLGRLASRFESLVAAVRARRLPPTPAPRGQAERDLELPRLEGLPPPRLPGRFGWLIRLVPGAAVYGSQLQYLLADPEMAALLAGSPQAGHILRPLCRMLGIRTEPELFASRGVAPASSDDAADLCHTAAPGGLPPDSVSSATSALPLRSGSEPWAASPPRAIPPASPPEPWPPSPQAAGLSMPANPDADPTLAVPRQRPVPG
ncbi:MAG: hypothetical protein JO110_17785 [Acetobacteraceae bacterium]|nr:hypothetical protein [Acetobacteraceae bacterium]